MTTAAAEAADMNYTVLTSKPPMFAVLTPRPISPSAPSLTSVSSEEEVVVDNRESEGQRKLIRMARNRKAAAHSRKRKREEMERLMSQNMELNQENAKLKGQLKGVLDILSEVFGVVCEEDIGDISSNEGQEEAGGYEWLSLLDTSLLEE